MDRIRLEPGHELRGEGVKAIRRVVGFLGAGEFGDVYSVHCNKTWKEAAKVISLGDRDGQPVSDSERVKILGPPAREASLMLNLGQHPNLVGLRAAFATNSCYYYVFVMDLVPGGKTLADVMGSLTATEAATVALMVARGLEHMHARGATHWDVKPSNILVELTLDDNAMMTTQQDADAAEASFLAPLITSFGEWLWCTPQPKQQHGSSASRLGTVKLTGFGASTIKTASLSGYDIETMNIHQLGEFVKDMGLDSSGCVEEADFRARAFVAAAETQRGSDLRRLFRGCTPAYSSPETRRLLELEEGAGVPDLTSTRRFKVDTSCAAPVDVVRSVAVAAKTQDQWSWGVVAGVMMNELPPPSSKEDDDNVRNLLLALADQCKDGDPGSRPTAGAIREQLDREITTAISRSLGEDDEMVYAMPDGELAQLHNMMFTALNDISPRSDEDLAVGEEHANEMLRIVASLRGPESLDCAAALDDSALLLFNKGKYAEAEGLYRRLLKIEKDSSDPGVAENVKNFGLLLEDLGKLNEAEEMYRQALSMYERAFGPDDTSVASLATNLARFLKNQGKNNEAKQLFDRALDICERVLGPSHPNVARVLTHVASLLRSRGQYGEAISHLERAVKINEDAGPENAMALANSLIWLALALSGQGKYEESLPLRRRCIEIAERALGSDHPGLSSWLHLLAMLLEEGFGEYAEAEKLKRRALKIDEMYYGEDHPEVANDLNNLTGVLNAQGKYEEALATQRRGLAIEERAFHAKHPKIALSLNNIATLLEAQGKPNEAKPLFDRALEIREETLGPSHPDVAVSLINLAVFWTKQGNFDEATPLYERAAKIREEVFGASNPSLADALVRLADVYKNQAKYERAERLYRRAAGIFETTVGELHPHYGLTLNNLALSLCAQRKFDQAEHLFHRALATMAKSVGDEHPNYALVLGNISSTARRQCNHDDDDDDNKAVTKSLYTNDEHTLIQEEVRHEAAPKPSHPDATSLDNAARALSDMGQYEQAEEAYRRAQKMDEEEEMVGRNTTRLEKLAALFETQRMYGLAEETYRSALEEFEEKASSSSGPKQPQVVVATFLARLASVLQAQGKSEEAKDKYEKSIGILELVSDEDHNEVGETLVRLADVLVAAKE
ncbi:hypothetical protein CTAYLR_002973, partial [Chrysophaeum taylorii]